MAGNTITYANAVNEIKDYLLVHDKVKDLLDGLLQHLVLTSKK